MKHLFFLPLLFIVFSVKATDYYISSAGNDNNNGQSASSPWRSIQKLNASFSSLRAGDRVLFNRGDVFYGSINVTQSGNSSSPITIGAYGSGANPVISGFTTVSSWTSLGGNIWESPAVSNLADCNMVNINGANTPMGRYPNTGYLKYQSFVGNTKITSSSLSSSPVWTGAEVVIRKQRWIIDRNKITNHSGNTITYQPTSNYNGQANYGFFIQNDAKTLDSQNEWYFDPNSKKLKIYSSSRPSNVRIATVDTLVTVKLRSYIRFENLTFEGANKNAFVILSSNDVTLESCNIYYTGVDAIWGSHNWGRTSNNFTMNNCTVKETNNNAIVLASEFTNATISNNSISNTGTFAGMGGFDSQGVGTHTGIRISASSPDIEYNAITNTGYNAIVCSGDYGVIKNNLVDRFCMVKIDGAGIYTVAGVGGTPYASQKILNNIVLNGIGNNDGTNTDETPIAHGIYVDDWSADIEVAGNSVANCSHSGIYIHNAYNINTHHNTSFNNGLYQFLIASFDVNKPVRNNTVNNNVFVAKQSNQYASAYQSRYNDFSSFGTIDNNYYARPLNNNGLIDISYNYYSVFSQYALGQWQNFSGQDRNSKAPSKSLTSANDIRFEYNASQSSKTIPLDGNYIDVKDVSYNGSITLAPYTSAVLMRNGAATSNQPPVVNAGNNQSITLPSNTATLNGSANDADGSIVSYSWTKTSGPLSGTIGNTSAASTTVNGLVQGVYQFQLTATDNRGATASDVVQISVNALNNSAPTANAGVNQTITWPQSTATLSGSGYDSDGSIASYQWSKVSGPATGTIANARSASTPVTDLSPGTYEFQLQVTDNDGSTASGTVRVTVVNDGLLPAVTLRNPVNGLEYDYYQSGGYTSVPDFKNLTPQKSGNALNFDLSLATRTTVYAFNFTGYINVPTDGYYTFYTNSDDGSMLYIDDRLVTDNDGLHGLVEKSGQIGLKAGYHKIAVGYVQQGGAATLVVSYEGPGVSKRAIPAASIFRESSTSDLLPDVDPGTTVNGIEYSYYQGNGFTNVPTQFSQLTPVKSGNTDNFNLSPALRQVVYAFNFSGYIKVPTDGYYTFYTTSDDGSILYIDGRQVVNNDGLHGVVERSGTIGLEAGFHAITVGYIQQGGSATLDVEYAGPGVSRQVIPAASLFRKFGSNELLPATSLGATIAGLNYDYYEGGGYTSVPDYTQMSAVKSGTVSNFDLSPARRSVVYSFNYTGYVNVPQDGYYTFYTNSDDGSKLYIDGRLVADNDGLHGAVERSGVIGLEAGYHAISVGYIQQGGNATLNVYYSGPGVGKQLIPANALVISASSARITGEKSMSLTPGRSNTMISVTDEALNPVENGVSVKAYPNPFVSSLTVTIDGEAGPVKLLLIDAAGRILYTKQDIKYNGRAQYKINTSRFTSGFYFIKALHNNKETVIKVEK